MSYSPAFVAYFWQARDVTNAAGDLPLGLYESVMTRGLLARLEAIQHLEPTRRKIDEADLPHALSRHVAVALERALTRTRNNDQRIAIANSVLALLEAAEEEVPAPASELLRLVAPPGPGAPATAVVRPTTPLTEAALLTNASGEPNLGSDVRAEIDTADQVDLLCAFVKWHGLRLLEQELLRLRGRQASFRVITTTYMGATERAAL